MYAALRLSAAYRHAAARVLALGLGPALKYISLYPFTVVDSGWLNFTVVRRGVEGSEGSIDIVLEERPHSRLHNPL